MAHHARHIDPLDGLPHFINRQRIGHRRYRRPALQQCKRTHHIIDPIATAQRNPLPGSNPPRHHQLAQYCNAIQQLTIRNALRSLDDRRPILQRPSLLTDVFNDVHAEPIVR